MKQSNSLQISRRDIITKVMPACAITCMAPLKALGMVDRTLSQDTKHKFDTEMEQKMTYRQMFQRQYFNLIMFGNLLKEEMGDEKAIELIKKLSDKSARDRGKMQAQQGGDSSLQAFVKPFKDDNIYGIVLTKEVVEDTETAFELKVTECLWAEAFREQKADDIGFAWICYGDYGWPEGFNPKLKMVRDKTLMEGHDCCNHRYVYKG